MVEELNFVSLREILSRVTRHPKLQGVDLETVIQYTLDYFALVGAPQMYEPKVAWVEINKYQGELPCDLVRIEQVRDVKTHVILRSMTDTFSGYSKCERIGAMTFRSQNRIITTSYEKGAVEVAYLAIKTDKDGIPMLPEGIFTMALEAYIKLKVFEILADEDKIRPDTLKRAQQDYAWLNGKCVNMFKMPSESEMQTLGNMMHRLIPSTNEFEHGYKGLGDAEHFLVH